MHLVSMHGYHREMNRHTLDTLICIYGRKRNEMTWKYATLSLMFTVYSTNVVDLSVFNIKYIYKDIKV